MDECELVILISTLACAVSKCCTDDEISLMANVFSQFGDTLATIIAKRELKDKKNNNDKIKDCSRIIIDSNNN